MKKPEDKKKVDTRGKNGVQPDGSVAALADDSKKAGAETKDTKEKEAPEIDADAAKTKKDKGDKGGAGKTKIDLDPELEIEPADKLEETRAMKVIRIAREYSGKTTFRTIE
jgi:hypothetical protein